MNSVDRPKNLQSSHLVQGWKWPAPAGEASAAAKAWQVAVEVPVALLYNGQSYGVMLLTPLDLEDFAVGFSLTEEVVTDPAAIDYCKVEPCGEGLRLDIAVDPSGFGPGLEKQRSLEGRSGCGLCGQQEIDQVHRLEHRVQPVTALPSRDVLLQSIARLAAEQRIHAENHSVHGAALFTLAGDFVALREDVGRHNALDKLIGATVEAGGALDQCFVVMTSRCSFELVKKLAVAGIPLMVTLSAPTSFAIQMAQKAGITLACRGEGGDIMVFQKGAPHGA